MNSFKEEMIKNSKPHQDLIKWYMDELGGADLTKKNYRDMLIRYANYLKINNIEKPRKSDLIKFVDFIYKGKDGKELHSAMAQKFVILFHSLYATLYDEDEYPNIALRLEHLKIKSDFQRRPLTIDEAKKLLLFSNKRKNKNILCARDNAILMLSLCTGLRTCEIANITIHDFSQEEAKTFVYIHGKDRPDKCDKVLVPDVALNAIQFYLDQRKDSNSYVFINHGNHSKGDHIVPATVSAVIKHLLRCIGIDDAHVTAHSLRHTFATIAMNNNAKLEEVSKVLRHKNISTTQIYEHAITRDKIETENSVASKLIENEDEFLIVDKK